MEKETKEKTVYTLELHEALEFPGSLGGKIEVTRVPGGWVYCFEYIGIRQSPIVFVPFDKEFTVKTPKNKKPLITESANYYSKPQ